MGRPRQRALEVVPDLIRIPPLLLNRPASRNLILGVTHTWLRAQPIPQCCWPKHPVSAWRITQRGKPNYVPLRPYARELCQQQFSADTGAGHPTTHKVNEGPRTCHQTNAMQVWMVPPERINLKRIFFIPGPSHVNLSRVAMRMDHELMDLAPSEGGSPRALRQIARQRKLVYRICQARYVTELYSDMPTCLPPSSVRMNYFGTIPLPQPVAGLLPVT